MSEVHRQVVPDSQSSNAQLSSNKPGDGSGHSSTNDSCQLRRHFVADVRLQLGTNSSKRDGGTDGCIDDIETRR